MKYSIETQGWYDPKIHGNKIPSDAVQVTDTEYKKLLSDQSNGLVIGKTEEGKLFTYVKPIDSSKLLDIVKDEIRKKRTPILDAISGIGFSAMIENDLSLANQAATARKKLLDITDDENLNSSSTYEQMKEASDNAFSKIKEDSSEVIKSAFRDI